MFFEEATKYVESNVAQFNEAELIELYSLYKIVTVGAPINPPAFYEIRKRVKWNAWCKYYETIKKPENAMEKYVQLVENRRGESREKQTFMVSVSVMKDDHVVDVRNKLLDLLAFCDENNKEKILTELSNINEQDDQGLTLLHYACDRGYFESLKFLLSLSGIDLNIQDNEGQTALHYCKLLERHDFVKLLLEHGASPDVVDREGNKAID